MSTLFWNGIRNYCGPSELNKYKLIKSEFNIKENLRLTFHQNITGEIDKN